MSNNPKHLIPSSPGLYPGRIEGRHAATVLFETDRLRIPGRFPFPATAAGPRNMTFHDIP